MYTIRIRRYKKAAIKRTRWGVEFGDAARLFALGYRAALRDMGLPHEVLVYDSDGRLYYNAED